MNSKFHKKSRPNRAAPKGVSPLSTLSPRDLHIVLAALVLGHLRLGMDSLAGDPSLNSEFGDWSGRLAAFLWCCHFLKRVI